MNPPNQLSDTPRTDAAWAKTFEADDDQCRAGNAATDMRDECAKIETELTRFRAEVERLTPYVSKAILTHGGTMLCSPQVGVAFNEMRDRAERAEAELATERARLDWLESRTSTVLFRYPVGAWSISDDAEKEQNLLHEYTVVDLRVAIDAAMKGDAK